MIEISVLIHATLDEVWEKWISIDGIQQWSFASDDWAAEGIINDVRKGGIIKNRNYAKDGSAEFMFEGKYTEVIPHKQLAFILGDGRKVEVNFIESGDAVTIKELFDPETDNPVEMQQQGWQAYLDNFKKFVESSKK